MELVGAPARVRQRVDRRRAHVPIPVAAQVIGALLVGYEKQEVRTRAISPP
jgi:hypothetical protein